MWYNAPALNNILNSHPKCNQCGCDLILVSQKTEKLGNSVMPMTTTVYRCSNQSCQEEIDKKISKHLELKEEREVSRQNRLKAGH